MVNRLPAIVLAAGAAFPAWATAQAAGGSPLAIGDPARLSGVASVAVRATAVWDEEITTSAGGATASQFQEALLTGFEAAIADAEAGPNYDADAVRFVLCHVDTFYDRGLIVYSVRVSYHAPSADGVSDIRWLHSAVGSYTTQQLHVIWTLSDQCAAAFLEAWREGNPGQRIRPPS